MAITYTVFEGNAKKAIEHFKKELQRIRTGRAHASLLEGIHADYYGARTPLIQLGMINAPESRLLTVQVYDNNAVEAVEKAIQAAGLGLNPSRDGNLLRIPIPALTEQRRKELGKGISKIGEETKIALRNLRRDFLDDLKKQEKDKKITPDDLKRADGEIQKILDRYTKEVDTGVAAKEKELLEV